MKQTNKTKSKFMLILFTMMFVLVSMFNVAIATSQEDLILQARYGYPLFDENVNYPKDTLVIYNGEIYNTLKLLDGKQIYTGSNLDSEYFINIANEKYKPPKNTSNYKQLKTKDKIKYTGEVSIKGEFYGNETFLTNKRLLGLDNYSVQDFEVVMYVGTNNVQYSIFHYDGMTDNRTLARQQGIHMFDVISENGFIKYTTNTFTTQTASIPNVYLPTVSTSNEYQQICFADYFTSYSTAYTEVSLWDIPTGWSTYDGNGDGIIPLVRESGFDAENPDVDLLWEIYAPCTEQLEIYSYDEPAEFEVSILVSDDFNDYDGDNFYVYVLDEVSATTDPVPDIDLGSTDCIEIDIDDYILNYQYIDVKYTDNGLQNLTGDINGTNDFNYDTIDVYVDGRGVVQDVKVEFCGNNQDFDQTITITGRDYFGNGDSITFDVTSTQITGGEGGGTASGTMLNNTEVYYSFDNTNLSGSTPLDLTPNNNDVTTVYGTPTTGVTGKVAQTLDWDGTNDFLEIPVDKNPNSDTFTINLWFNSDVAQPARLFHSGDYEFAIVYDRASFPDKIEWITFDGVTEEKLISTTTISTGTWYMVTVSHVAGGTSKLYLDATVEDTGILQQDIDTRSATASIGALSGGGGQFLDGKIDEFSIFNYTLNQSEINFLYNNSNPTTDQQYPYTVNATTGATSKPYYDVIFPNPINATVYEDYLVNMDYRWQQETEDSYYVSFVDPDNSSQINITDLQSYTGQSFYMAIADGTLTIQPYDSITNSPLEVTFQACNTLGCNWSTVNMTISGANPPTFSGSYPVTLNYNEDESDGYNLENYFTNFNKSLTYIYFDDTINNSLINLSINQSSQNSYFTVGLTTNNFLYLQTNNNLSAAQSSVNQEINVTVCNEFGCTFVENFWTFGVVPDPEIPPVQILVLPTIQIGYNETYNLSLDTYYNLATYYIVNYTHPITGVDISYNDTGSASYTYYNVELLNDVIYFSSNNLELLNQDYYVYGCNAVGCTQFDTMSFNIYETPITTTTPQAIDESFDDILGQGTTKAKLLVALFIIVIGFVMGFSWSKTVLVGLFGAFVGMVVSVVFGLINIWLIVIVIIVLVLLLLVSMAFDKN